MNARIQIILNNKINKRVATKLTASKNPVMLNMKQ